MKRLILTLLGGIFLVRCSNDDLPKFYQLGPLRALAVIAQPPEAAPGGVVQLTALLNATDAGTAAAGADVSVAYTAIACPDPGIALGSEPGCAEPATATPVGAGTLTLTAPTYTGSLVPPPLTVPAGFAQSVLLVVFSFEIAGGAKLTAFKRIVVSNSAAPNANPTLSAIEAQGADLTQLPTAATDLTPRLGAGAAETYQETSTAGTTTRTETLTVTWYISRGEVKRSRTDAASPNYWTPPASGAGAIFLVPVLSDDRGGLAVLQPSAVVGP